MPDRVVAVALSISHDTLISIGVAVFWFCYIPLTSATTIILNVACRHIPCHILMVARTLTHASYVAVSPLVGANPRTKGIGPRLYRSHSVLDHVMGIWGGGGGEDMGDEEEMEDVGDW
jgi:hypothetical protein